MTVGIDIVKLTKFNKTLKSINSSFLGKTFTNREITNNTSDKLPSIFAAKEAFIKAYTNKVKLTDIEISHNEIGRPVLLEPSSIYEKNIVDISISHDGDYVIAICIIESK